jgi:hypothetical protein
MFGELNATVLIANAASTVAAILPGKTARQERPHFPADCNLASISDNEFS